MRITQGTFSFLPDLTDEQIEAQLRYALRNGWAIMVEHTDDPHPRNALWEMWAPPQFDLIEDDVDVVDERDPRGARGVAARLREGRLLRPLARAPDDGAVLHRRPARRSSRASAVERQEKADRQIRYTIHAYATDAPSGHRYGATGTATGNGGRAS